MQFLIGKAPIEVYKRYGYVSLGSRDKNGRGPEDPRPVGNPESSWRWAVGACNKVVEAHSKKLLLPHKFAIGVRSGAEKMGKRTSFDAAQLPKHQWLIPDAYNASNELDRRKPWTTCARCIRLEGR